MTVAFHIPAGEEQGPDDFIGRHGGAAFDALVARAEPVEIVARIKARIAKDNGDPDAVAAHLDDLPLMLELASSSAAQIDAATRAFKKAGVAPSAVKRACKDAKELLHNKRAQRRSGTAPRSTFLIEDFGYVRRDVDRKGNETETRLSEFTVEFEEELDIRFGDAPPVCRIRCTARYPGRPSRKFDLDSGDLKNCNWVYEKLGAPAIIDGGPSRYSGVLEAIQRTSNPERVTAYGHTGFVTTDEGVRVFVHSGGAVGADGVRAELGPSLATYRLSPAPKDEDGLRVAIRHVLAFVETADEFISFAVLGMVMRSLFASVAPIPFVLFLLGMTGHLKSTFMAAAMRHFGKDWKPENFEGFSSTANYLERQLHLASDVVLVIDDLVKGPDRGANDVDAKAERIFRAVGNTAARGRCASDGSTREPLRPRCGLAVTAEHAVQGHSLNGRMLSVPFEVDSVRRDTLRTWKKDAVSPSAAIAAFIEHYILPSYDEFRADARSEIETIRDEEFAEQKAHPRTPENLANLYFALRHFFAFCEAMEAVTSEEREALEQRSIAALRKLGDLQTEAVRQADPVNIFVEVFASLLSQRKLRVFSDGGSLPSSVPLVAWPDPADRSVLCVDAQAAFGAVNRELATAGRMQLPNMTALHQQLVQRYFPRSRKGERSRTQVTNPESGTRVTGFRIPVKAVWADDPSTADAVRDGGAYDVC